MTEHERDVADVLMGLLNAIRPKRGDEPPPTPGQIVDRLAPAVARAIEAERLDRDRQWCLALVSDGDTRAQARILKAFNEQIRNDTGNAAITALR